ncbi:MAG: DNA-processing protein DprA [Spirochaetia bacterium]
MLSILELALNRLRILKPLEKILLSEILDDPSRLAGLSRRGVEELIGRRLFRGAWEPGAAVEAARVDLDYLSAGGIGTVTYLSPEYPPQLKEIYDPPFLLFVRGRLPGNDIPQVAVVGTRKPTGAAKAAAFRLGVDFARAGVPVVSGLARGVDSEAHRGTVAASGVTTAVLGCGIDEVYPKENKKLAAEIIEKGGGLVSEYPPGMPPLKYNFPERNRIISGLSRTVILVQAPARSGALITADYSLEQGRDLVVVSGCFDGVPGLGSRELAESGAPCIRCAADVLEEWGFDPQSSNVSCGRNAPEETRDDGPAGGVKGEAEYLNHIGTGLASSLEAEILGLVIRNAGEAV